MIRRASIEDRDFCFNLRNHKTVFPTCGRARPLTKEEYLQTLTSKTHLFIIENNMRMGYLRFDPHNTEGSAYIISIALLPEHRGFGIGQLAIRLGMKEMRFFTPTFLATVRKENEASNKLFLKCGFQLIADDTNFNYYGIRS